ncbi:COX15/CtaA family protein [Candidatus Parabeggiatoa sp. HSG14]|uniref:COX15/CtaA family protein n=1 Tax=Candidatus Parabeggiatoa sp. HSG14 TaxID=3055593 RepID=UPI0025A7A381|nr:COX15/CtaA family protein [Thiotrichales bacterium HSG14]
MDNLQDLTSLKNRNKPIAIWLFICCMAIFAMVILGGVTRLTGSGLSMVDWAPIMGILPPLNHSEWEAIFQQYQQYPEYKEINSTMTLEGFKTIFWFEYTHRLLGRAIGLIFLIPLIYFSIKGKINKPLIPKMITMFVLGGLQGLLGWYMVKSGLSDNPHVSQYRLTAHLGLAVVIYAYLFWVALDLLFPRNSTNGDTRNLRHFSFIITGLIFLTVLSGGFVAGLKAGFAYNTFPLMAGHLIPEGLFTLEPLWRNFFENVTTVQFDHRLLATILFVLIPILWWVARRVNLPSRTRWGFHIFLIILGIQVTLGISTLLLYVPTPLAAIHQGGALGLLTIALFVSHELH